eukprot:TRINITY_DN11612_c1_g1_i2.p1 TRINITY_DN11612_c1_g1~~TRINITY_DN11612_c1_g1_i2.p1  ORF type:complete len:128 (+),score=28.67 TRINITY_DN11612_c1_g1_i2:928-1311(+)
MVEFWHWSILWSTRIPKKKNKCSEFFSFLKSRILSFILGIPIQNIHSLNDYRTKLENSGFVEIVLEPLDKEFVWNSFLKWITCHKENFGGLVNPGLLDKYQRAARFMSFLSSRGYVEMIVVKAKKGQ